MGDWYDVPPSPGEVYGHVLNMPPSERLGALERAMLWADAVAAVATEQAPEFVHRLWAMEADKLREVWQWEERRLRRERLERIYRERLSDAMGGPK